MILINTNFSSIVYSARRFPIYDKKRTRALALALADMAELVGEETGRFFLYDSMRRPSCRPSSRS